VQIKPPVEVLEGEKQANKFIVLDSIEPPSQESQLNQNVSIFTTSVRDE
jgi:hypothetical protein